MKCIILLEPKYSYRANEILERNEVLAQHSSKVRHEKSHP